MRHLRAAARLIRGKLIKTGFDRKLADATYRRPRRLLTRLFRPDILDYRGAGIRRVTRDGITFDLDPSDYVQWTIYFGIEREEKSALFNLAKPGYVALDIGTNVGEVLLNFAKRVGPDGRAIGFEPNPETLAKCRHNLRLNGFSNVEVHGFALGDTQGEVSIGRVDETNAGADRVVASGGVAVPLTTLDEFAKSLERLDLIKIDVEGFDLKVLRGGEHDRALPAHALCRVVGPQFERAGRRRGRACPLAGGSRLSCTGCAYAGCHQVNRRPPRLRQGRHRGSSLSVPAKRLAPRA